MPLSLPLAFLNEHVRTDPAELGELKSELRELKRRLEKIERTPGRLKPGGI